MNEPPDLFSGTVIKTFADYFDDYPTWIGSSFYFGRVVSCLLFLAAHRFTFRVDLLASSTTRWNNVYICLSLGTYPRFFKRNFLSLLSNRQSWRLFHVLLLLDLFRFPFTLLFLFPVDSFEPISVPFVNSSKVVASVQLIIWVKLRMRNWNSFRMFQNLSIRMLSVGFLNFFLSFSWLVSFHFSCCHCWQDTMSYFQLLDEFIRQCIHFGLDPRECFLVVLDLRGMNSSSRSFHFCHALPLRFSLSFSV